MDGDLHFLYSLLIQIYYLLLFLLKKDLFYYIRNALVHYNGAYFTAKYININYKGTTFNSIGHEGEKIYIKDINQAFSIHLDIEQYAYKAWNNFKNFYPQFI